jgi:hypothetical protein
MSSRGPCFQNNTQNNCSYVPNHDVVFIFGGQIALCDVVNHDVVEPIDSDVDLDADTSPTTWRSDSLTQKEV